MNQTSHERMNSMQAAIRSLQIRHQKALEMIAERDRKILALEEKVEGLTQNIRMMQQISSTEAGTELVGQSPEQMRREGK